MKTFSFSFAVIIMLALFFIQGVCTISIENRDLAETRDVAAEFYEIPADQWKVAYNRQKRHSEPGECRMCCNCCGQVNFCGLCCQW
ncbi:hepcidin-like [Corythoichthys intestinalis]|uniref:hepcidin-like n=1 Tax=Corythoichthys intestinalis TaxID=161448 RepID=UPI0025A4FDA6|nr:hepcidin-like [Corythoichthys intestinalis]